MGRAVERSPHLHWGQCRAVGTVRGGASPPLHPTSPPRPDCMSPALPHRGVRSVARATPRPSPTPQGLPGHVGRTYLVPPAAAASQLLLTCLKSQREGRHDPGTSALWVGAKSGGSCRTVTPLTPALSGDTVRPGRGVSAKKPCLPGCTPCPCRLHPC